MKSTDPHQSVWLRHWSSYCDTFCEYIEIVVRLHLVARMELYDRTLHSPSVMDLHILYIAQLVLRQPLVSQRQTNNASPYFVASAASTHDLKLKESLLLGTESLCYNSVAVLGTS